LGAGLGNFAGSYGEKQAEYFASGAGSVQNRNVAGSPEYGFNEYIQIAVEFGVLGLLLFITIAIHALYLGIKSKHHAAVSSLVALLIFASMSYPFNVLPFVIVLVFLLAFCVSNTKQVTPLKNGPVYLTTGLFGALLAITIISSYSRINSYHAYDKWITVDILKTDRIRDNVLSLCAEIYPELKHEIRFVFDYANLLKDEGQYLESNRVLQQGMKISCDPVLYNLAGTNSQLMKDYSAAESYYRKAADLVPNRLLPYYLLAKLYVEIELYEQACEMAKIVLTKEPKINSQAVREMRKEMKKICTDN
jgi:tetratricopeptide (TPR) repeat protein